MKLEAANRQRLGTLAVLDLARCDREIEEIKARDNSAERAYLCTMGINDWETEKRLLLSPPASGERR